MARFLSLLQSDGCNHRLDLTLHRQLEKHMSTDPKADEIPIKLANRKSGRAWLGWFLWLTTVAGIYFVRYEGVQRDAELQRSQQALVVLMERVDQTLAATDSKRVVAALAQQDVNLQAIQARMESSDANLTEALKQQKDVNGRIQAALGPEGGNIEDAMKLAEEAKSAGNTELALVYLANAIRSQPRDIRLLAKYTTWVVESKNPTVMQGAESLLQGALYGVPAKDVLDVTERLEEVTKALAAQQPPVGAPISNVSTPADSFAELSKAVLDSFSGDRKKVEARAEALSAILEQINEGDQPDSKLRDQVSQQLAEAQACALAHQVLSLAEMRFNNLATTESLVATESSTINRTAALAALQATEAAVNQVWSVPVALVTSELKKKLIALPAKLKTQAENIQNAVEREDIADAQKGWVERRNQSAVLIQHRIIGCKAAIELCSKKLGKVQGPESRKQAAELYEKMSKEMKALQEQQLAAYQKWAVDQIERARLHYESTSLHWDTNVFEAFYSTEFQAIDQRFLTPDVDQFLQGVFSILCNKLNAEGKAELQRQMAFPSPPHDKQKRTLESF